MLRSSLLRAYLFRIPISYKFTSRTNPPRATKARTITTPSTKTLICSSISSIETASRSIYNTISRTILSKIRQSSTAFRMICWRCWTIRTPWRRWRSRSSHILRTFQMQITLISLITINSSKLVLMIQSRRKKMWAWTSSISRRSPNLTCWGWQEASLTPRTIISCLRRDWREESTQCLSGHKVGTLTGTWKKVRLWNRRIAIIGSYRMRSSIYLMDTSKLIKVK